MVAAAAPESNDMFQYYNGSWEIVECSQAVHDQIVADLATSKPEEDLGYCYANELVFDWACLQSPEILDKWDNQWESGYERRRILGLKKLAG